MKTLTMPAATGTQNENGVPFPYLVMGPRVLAASSGLAPWSMAVNGTSVSQC